MPPLFCCLILLWCRATELDDCLSLNSVNNVGCAAGHDGSVDGTRIALCGYNRTPTARTSGKFRRLHFRLHRPITYVDQLNISWPIGFTKWWQMIGTNSDLCVALFSSTNTIIRITPSLLWNANMDTWLYQGNITLHDISARPIWAK